MSKRIPVKTAKEIAESMGCRQVIVIAWDGYLTHVVTWGKTVVDCSQAADGGNELKKHMGWPKHNDQPSRVRKLEKRILELEAELAKGHCTDD